MISPSDNSASTQMNWMLIHFVCGTRSIKNLSIGALMTTMSCALDILQVFMGNGVY